MSLSERLAIYLTARPAQWVDGRELAKVAGAYAWRSRCSDLRKPPFNLTIENRQRKQQTLLGETVTVSEYRLVPAELPTDMTNSFVLPQLTQNSCFCASLGDDRPCGWCDGPTRDTETL